MRQQLFTDRNGWRRVALIRDNDPDEAAPLGIPMMTVDINDIDWEAAKKEIHNYLIDHQVYEWADVQRAQNAVSNAIRASLQKRIVDLYRANGRDGSQEELDNE